MSKDLYVSTAVLYICNPLSHWQPQLDFQGNEWKKRGKEQKEDRDGKEEKETDARRRSGEAKGGNKKRGKGLPVFWSTVRQRG